MFSFREAQFDLLTSKWKILFTTGGVGLAWPLEASQLLVATEQQLTGLCTVQYEYRYPTCTGGTVRASSLLQKMTPSVSASTVQYVLKVSAIILGVVIYRSS